MRIGIDKIAIYLPEYYIDIKDLAQARNVDVDKYKIGLMLSKMSINSKNDNVEQFAYKAGKKVVDEYLSEIDLCIVATESSEDHSKSISSSIHDKLGLKNECMSFEIKQACYGGVVAMNMAYNHIRVNPDSKVLVITTDIAKYGINSNAEATQGCGAIAMIVSKDPRIVEILNENSYYTENVYDFYRPIQNPYPIVDGKLSTDTYIRLLDRVYNDYAKKYSTDFSAICFHIPYPKIALKSLRKINTNLEDKFLKSIEYNKQVGNIYTGSIFLNLVCLLDNVDNLDKIGMYSYGSGATAQFFSLKVVDGYKKYLNTKDNIESIKNRKKLTIQEYEAMFF